MGQYSEFAQQVTRAEQQRQAYWAGIHRMMADYDLRYSRATQNSFTRYGPDSLRPLTEEEIATHNPQASIMNIARIDP